VNGHGRAWLGFGGTIGKMWASQGTLSCGSRECGSVRGTTANILGFAWMACGLQVVSVGNIESFSSFLCNLSVVWFVEWMVTCKV